MVPCDMGILRKYNVIPLIDKGKRNPNIHAKALVSASKIRWSHEVRKNIVDVIRVESPKLGKYQIFVFDSLLKLVHDLTNLRNIGGLSTSVCEGALHVTKFYFWSISDCLTGGSKMFLTLVDQKRPLGVWTPNPILSRFYFWKHLKNFKVVII